MTRKYTAMTEEDRQIINQIIQDKEDDLIYRDWTRRVKARLKSLNPEGDDKLKMDLTMLDRRLKDLERIYTKRITASSLANLGRKFNVHPSTIKSVSSRSAQNLMRMIELNTEYAVLCDMHAYLKKNIG